MTRFHDMMRFAKTGIAHPDITGFDKLKALSLFQQSYPSQTITGVPPISFKANGQPLAAWSISGNTVQTGTPTPDNPIYPNFVGERTENLVDDPSTYVNGYINASGNLVGQSQTNLEKTSLFMPIPSGTTELTLSSKDAFPSGVNGVWIAIACYSSNTLDSFLGRRTSSDQTLTYEIPAGTKYARVSLRTYGDTVYCMLNTGSTAKPYEPYGYKLPVTCGTTTPIYLGQTQTVRRVKKLVLTGQEDWSYQSQYERFVLTMNDILATGIRVDTFYTTHYQVIDDGRGIENVPNNAAYIARSSSTTATINIKMNAYTSADDFKQFLSDQYAAGAPVCIWYVLAEPETGIVNEPLFKIGNYVDTVASTNTGAPSIPTVKGQNTLTVDTTVQPSEVSITT